jgi:hypothetical protein
VTEGNVIAGTVSAGTVISGTITGGTVASIDVGSGPRRVGIVDARAGSPAEEFAEG